MSKNRFFHPRRLTIDGILTALFFILSLYSVEIMGVKITLDALPAILCALLFGPIDAFLVGFLGTFLEQLLHYGFTATTLLWVIPPALRGLLLGLLLVPIRRRGGLTEKRNRILVIVCSIFAGMVTSTGNTLAYYVDSTLYGYYNYALVFGVYFWRLFTGAAVSIACTLVALPVASALKKNGLTDPKE